jgi:pantetheine-phosphate adenylyltransferase
MARFDVVAMGGTFDMIHKGHIALLETAFSLSDMVIIGLTSDELATKKGKKIQYTYQQRFERLEQFIESKFQRKSYLISKLDNDFGPAAIQGDVQALIVSEETAYQGEVLNKLRAEKNLGPVQTVVVPMIMAADGKRISSTRIRNSEIDAEGNLL